MTKTMTRGQCPYCDRLSLRGYVTCGRSECQEAAYNAGQRRGQRKAQHPKHADFPPYEQGTDYADVADGLIGIADELTRRAKILRQWAREVREGKYLSDFAYAGGRSTIHDVARLVELELPAAWDEAVAAVALRKHQIAIGAIAATRAAEDEAGPDPETLIHPCVHAHYDCSTRYGGPCSDEQRSLAEARAQKGGR